MSILVVCPGCKKSFNVSDKFAGQTGACPKCKAKIAVPTKAQEVKVHTPTQFASGGRGTSGDLLTKPIARKAVKFEPVTAAIVAAASLVVLLIAWAGGRVFQNSAAACFLGLVVISPPLVVAAYAVLHPEEDLEPFRGKVLYIRSGICALAYIVLWAFFAALARQGILSEELWTWVFVAPPFLVVGALAAMASLDLEFGSAFFHFSFYLLVTILIRRIAGVGWVWEVGGTPGA